MYSSEISVSRAPYGLAFEIEDLVTLRRWVEPKRLRLHVLLDRTHDGQEFEELLVVAPPGSRRRTLTLWRTRDGIFAQTPTGLPHRFGSMVALLAQVQPARPRRETWLRRLCLPS